MTGINRRAGPLAVALCTALAACSSPPAPAGDNATAGGNVAAVDAPEVEANAEAPTRSILRPDVVPAPEEPTLEPLDEVIAFDDDGAALTQASAKVLDDIAAGPVAAAGGAIVLRGHSDTRGSDRANLAASRKRAEIVRAYLVERGIAPERLSVIALGETTPLVPNARPDGSDDPEARARNRRVEVHVALPAPAPEPAPAPAGAPAATPGDAAPGNRAAPAP